MKKPPRGCQPQPPSDLQPHARPRQDHLAKPRQLQLYKQYNMPLFFFFCKPLFWGGLLLSDKLQAHGHIKRGNYKTVHLDITLSFCFSPWFPLPAICFPVAKENVELIFLVTWGSFQCSVYDLRVLFLDFSNLWWA